MARFRAIFESRGFSRVLQLIFAFATMIVVLGFKQLISVNLNCKPNSAELESQNKEIVVTVAYPFNLGPTTYETCGNLTDSTKTLTKSQYPVNYGSHSQFFMSSIFITFLSSSFLLYCYIYQEISLVTRLPFHNIDFWLSCSVSFYTFVAAITFSVCAGGLHNNATPLVLTQVLSSDSHNICNEHKVQNNYYMTCTHGRSMDDSNLMVGTCLGWIMFVLSIGMIWFTYKEVKDGKWDPKLTKLIFNISSKHVQKYINTRLITTKLSRKYSYFTLIFKLQLIYQPTVKLQFLTLVLKSKYSSVFYVNSLHSVQNLSYASRHTKCKKKIYL